MPANAIATHTVQQVLALDDIAEAIIRPVRHPRRPGPAKS
jgi:chemotaxis response regulator CheB